MASFSSAFRSAWSRHAAKAGSGGVVALGMLATTMSDHQGQGQRRLAYVSVEKEEEKESESGVCLIVRSSLAVGLYLTLTGVTNIGYHHPLAI